MKIHTELLCLYLNSDDVFSNQIQIVLKKRIKEVHKLSHMILCRHFNPIISFTFIRPVSSNLGLLRTRSLVVSNLCLAAKCFVSGPVTIYVQS